MELLPIIYISVALFTIVIIVVLIVSYFSYRIKKASGKLDSNENYKIELKPLTKSKSPSKSGKKKRSGKHEKKTSSVKSRASKKETKKSAYQLSGKKKRISILNESINDDKMRVTNASEADDLLNSYSDEEDENLFTMKVNKKRKKS